MRKIFIALLALTSALSISRHARSDDEPRRFIGQYICITDRAVGINSPKGGEGAPYAGVITVDSEHKHFFVSVDPIKKSDRPETMSDPNSHVVAHYEPWCVGNSVDKRMEYEWRQNTESDWVYNSQTRQKFEQYCLPRTALTIKGHLTYYSDDDNVFLDHFGNKFWIYGDANFTWYYNDFEGNDYLLQGRCESVK